MKPKAKSNISGPYSYVRVIRSGTTQCFMSSQIKHNGSYKNSNWFHLLNNSNNMLYSKSDIVN